MTRSSLLCFLAAALCLAACPQGDLKKEPEPCRKLGDQCQLEPGKLGACAYRGTCTTPDCLYCQSQH